MTLDGCGKFLKYSIFFVNFVIFLIGMAIVGLGIWAVADGSEINKVLSDSQFVSSAAVMLTFGGVVAFISFLGCCGAIKEVKCLLMLFFIILLLITIGITVAVVLAFQIKDEVNDVIKQGLYESMKDSKEDEAVRKAWDGIQQKLKCCGAILHSDWITAAGLSIPDSCKCTPDDGEKADGNCQTEMDGEPRYWNHGCLEGIKDEIKRHTVPLVGVGIAIAIIIILAMVFSCALFLKL